MKTKNLNLKIIVFIVLLLLTLAYLLPIYLMVANSLKSIEQITKGNYLLPPSPPVFSNYIEVLFGSNRFRSEMMPRLLNSIIISFSVTALCAFFGGLGGFYLARTKTTFTRILFVLVGILESDIN